MTLFAPLPSLTSTRVLVLHRGSDDDVLRLSQKVIDVKHKNTPSFEAVSYTWGSSRHQQTIQLNGQSYTIYKNLYDCLIRLRKSLRSRTLWIDALSISQSDLVEKGQQVAIIGQIFRAAHRVLAWLGEHDASSRIVFSEIKNRKWSKSLTKKTWIKRNDDHLFGPVSRSDHFLQWLVRDKEAKRSSQPTSKQTSPTLVQEQRDELTAIRDAYKRFIRREYFRRTWIMQEIIIADTLLLHCGQDTATWEEFEMTPFGSFGYRPDAARLWSGAEDLFSEDESDTNSDQDNDDEVEAAPARNGEGLETDTTDDNWEDMTDNDKRKRFDDNDILDSDSDKGDSNSNRSESELRTVDWYISGGRESICSKVARHRWDRINPIQVNAKRSPGAWDDLNEWHFGLYRIIAAYSDTKCQNVCDKLWAMQSLDRRQFWQDEITPDYTAQVPTLILHIFTQKLVDSDCGLVWNRIICDDSDDGRSSFGSVRSLHLRDDWFPDEEWSKYDDTKGMPIFMHWYLASKHVRNLMQAFRMTGLDLISLLRAIQLQLETFQTPNSEWDFYAMCLWRYAAYTFVFAAISCFKKAGEYDWPDCPVCGLDKNERALETFEGGVHRYGGESYIPTHEEVAAIVHDMIKHLLYANYEAAMTVLNDGLPEPCKVPPLPSWWGDSEAATLRRKEIFGKHKDMYFNKDKILRDWAFDWLRQRFVLGRRGTKAARKVIFGRYAKEL